MGLLFILKKTTTTIFLRFISHWLFKFKTDDSGIIVATAVTKTTRSRSVSSG